MSKINPQTAWSLYWSQDRLHSCVASRDERDQTVLDAEWMRFAESLPDAAQVLDLATGNGAVPKALLAARRDLQIDAVDHASIDPLRFLSDKGALDAVRFHGETDILKLDFDDESFDAITSQFGIEYAGLAEAGVSCCRYLKPNGRLLFFIHHADSELISDSGQKKIELERLVDSNGLLNSLQTMLGGNLSLTELEQHGAMYLEGEFPRSVAISGQVFAGIDKIIGLLGDSREQAQQLAATLDMRVRSEYQRLCQMIAVAQSENSMNEFSETMMEVGISLEYDPLTIEHGHTSYLLCWKVQGSK